MYRYYATYPEKGMHMLDLTFISSYSFICYALLFLNYIHKFNTYLAHILHVVIYILLYILKSEGNIFPKLFVSANKFSNINPVYNLWIIFKLALSSRF